MITEEEQKWLLVYYWSASPLARTVDASHLTELEQTLVRKGLAIVKDTQTHMLTAPTVRCTQYITASELGRNYIMEYRFRDLLLWGLDLRHHQEVEKLLGEVSTEKLPELVVCEDAYLRTRVNEQLAKRNGNR